MVQRKAMDSEKLMEERCATHPEKPSSPKRKRKKKVAFENELQRCVDEGILGPERWKDLLL